MTGRPQIDDLAYYGLAGDVVQTLAPHTEADPVGLLVDFLVSFGSAVGRGPHARAEASDHPGRLNAVLVGKTSRSRKGSTRARIRQIMTFADPGWAQMCVISGLSSGEGLIDEVHDGQGDDPGVIDKRRLVVEGEFARVLNVIRREGNTLSTTVRDAWDGQRLSTLTRKSNRLVATHAHISILGQITEEEIRAKLTETEMANGFANRFLWACVERSQLLPAGGDPPETELSRLGRLCRNALTNARKVGTVRRTPEAENVWADMYREMAVDPGGLVGAVTARAEAQTLRLSVIYALTDDSHGQIDVCHLDAAYALWNYCEASAAHIFGDATGDPIADKLLEAIRAAGDSGLDGSQQRDLFSRHVGGKQLDHARQLLEARSLVVTVAEETGGRPRTITRIIHTNGKS